MDFFKKIISRTLLYKQYASLKFDFNYNNIFGVKGRIRIAKKIIPKNSKVVWVGINKNSDESGLLNGLKKTFNTKVYYLNKSTYGLGNNSNYDYGEIQVISNKFFGDINAMYNQKKVDIIIGQFMGVNIDSLILNKIQNLGIKVISLSWDDKLTFLWQKDYKKSCHSISKSIDYVLCSSIDALPKYKNGFFFPLGSSKEIFYSNTDSNKKVDILFVGNNYGFRGKVIKFLVKKGYNVRCYGNGFDNGFINYLDAAKEFGSAKIILGIGYVSYSKKITTLKLRDFDSMISGGLYITSFNEELNYLFGNAIPYYKNLNQLDSILKYYLCNDKERELLAKKQQESIIGKYEWENLFAKLSY